MKPPQLLHALGIEPFSGPVYSYPRGAVHSALAPRDLRFLAHLVRCDPSRLGARARFPADWLLYRDDWIIACAKCIRNDKDAGIAPFERAIWRQATCTLCLRHRTPLTMVQDISQEIIDGDKMPQGLNSLEEEVLPELLAFESDIARAFRGVVPGVLDGILSASEFRQVIGVLATFVIEAWSTGGCGTINVLSKHSLLLSRCPTLFHTRCGSRRYARIGTGHKTLGEVADPATRRAALWLILQVLQSLPTRRKYHPLHLGRSAHDEFLGTIRHDGHDWLADQAQAWPEGYRTTFWPEFSAPSATFKGTSVTFKGTQCH